MLKYLLVTNNNMNKKPIDRAISFITEISEEITKKTKGSAQDLENKIVMEMILSELVRFKKEDTEYVLTGTALQCADMERMARTQVSNLPCLCCGLGKEMQGIAQAPWGSVFGLEKAVEECLNKYGIDKGDK